MDKSFTTELKRAISGSFARFIAIALIVFLGCGFYAGLCMTGNDMRVGLSRWTDGSNLFDIQLISTLGFDKDQLDTVKGIDGVQSVEGVHSIDAMCTLKHERYVVRIQDFDLDSAINSVWLENKVEVQSDNKDYLNRLVVEEGRFPTKDDECVLSADRIMGEPIGIGDEVGVLYGQANLDNILHKKKFKVVGLVHSPLYISSVQLGYTSLGSGSIQQFMYVAPCAFTDDTDFSEMFVTCTNTEDLSYSSPLYQEEVDKVKDRIDAQVDDLEASRISNIKQKGQEQIDSGWNEYNENKELLEYTSSRDKANLAKSQVQRALDAVEQGKLDYEAGKIELNEAKAKANKEFALAQQAIDTSQSQLDKELSEVGMTKQECLDKKHDLQNKIIENNKENSDLHSKLTEVNKDILAVELIDSQLLQLDARQKSLDAQISSTNDSFDRSQESLDRLKSSNLITQEDYDKRSSELETRRQESQERFNKQQEDITIKKQELLDKKDSLGFYLEGLVSQKKDLEDQIDQNQKDRQALVNELEACDKALSKLYKLQLTQNDIDTSQRKLDGQIASSNSSFAYTEASLNRLKNGVGIGSVFSGASTHPKKASIADAFNVDAQLLDAASQLEKAQSDIDSIDSCDIYVLDRAKNVGCALYDADANRMDSIATIFPLMFFFVAALVSLTTMTRMVEDERVEIGTHKALGFSSSYIAGKYLAYSALASGIGGLLGVLNLAQVLPIIITKAYGVVYAVPVGGGPMPIDMVVATRSILVGVGVTLLATWAAVKATLKESPASLMLPKAPKPGKRILLERLPIWRSFSFSWKVTLRNLFRYKKRLIMTIVGIGGCTALVLTGLGLHDSISDIIDMQYTSDNPITSYNCAVGFVSDASCSDIDAIDEVLVNTGEADRLVYVEREQLQLKADDDKQIGVTTLIPSSYQDLDKVVSLRDRTSQKTIGFDDNSVVITEKAASMLDVGIGDEINLYTIDDIGDSTDTSYTLKVTGIAENYVSHFVYVGKSAWHKATGQDIRQNCVLSNVDSDWFVRSRVSEQLEEIGVVNIISYNNEIIESYTNSLVSVNMVVGVLVVAAAALAFIVLYNLTNVNIIERTREIASLKVLGFMSGEVSLYVFREIFLSVVIGSLAGVGFGRMLVRFVIESSETDVVMFGRYIHPTSYVLALLITLVFAVVVMMFMEPKLRKIDMVESLKSIDG